VPHKHVLLKAIRYPQRNRESVIGVVTGPRVRWSVGQIPERANVSLFPKIIHMNSGVYPASYSVCKGFLPGNTVGC